MSWLYWFGFYIWTTSFRPAMDKSTLDHTPSLTFAPAVNFAVALLQLHSCNWTSAVAQLQLHRCNCTVAVAQVQLRVKG